MRILPLVMLAMICLALRPATGQILNPTVGGLPVHCTDATGAPVYTVFNPNMGDAGLSTIEPNGMRIIMLNPNTLGGLPPLFQLLTYAHECGHHLSGDIVAMAVFHENDLNREKTADRIGIRLLRDQLHITGAQAAALASFFVNNPPMFPYYLPGPQRAQWIVNCFNSNDDNCTVAAGAAAAGTASAGSFCSVLKNVMSGAVNGFSAFRGARLTAGDDNWRSSRLLPGFSDCTVFGTGSDATHSCSSAKLSDDSAADDLYNQYRSQVGACLGAGWAASGHESNGNPLIRFEKDGAKAYVEVERRSLRNGGVTVDVDVQIEP